MLKTSNLPGSKICFVENEYVDRDSSGGIMTYLINLSRYFMGAGHETVLIGTGEKGNDNTSFSQFKSVYTKSQIGNFMFFLQLFSSKAIGHIGKEDIIHVQRPEMVIPLFFRTRNRIICTMHGGQDKAVYSKKGPFAGFAYSLLLFISFLIGDRFIVVDDKNYQRYLTRYPWLKKKMEVIPISIDTDKFGLKSKSKARLKYDIPLDQKVILFVGRLEYEKNVEFIIECFSRIEDVQDYKLIIAGSGTLEKKLKEMADPLGDRIVFLGELPNDSLPDLYACADVLVMASFFEGSPTVVKEALCSGVPVMSTDVGDVRRVLDSINGGFVMQPECSSFLTGLKKIEELPGIDKEKAKQVFNIEQMGRATAQVFFGMK